MSSPVQNLGAALFQASQHANTLVPAQAPQIQPRAPQVQFQTPQVQPRPAPQMQARPAPQPQPQPRPVPAKIVSKVSSVSKAVEKIKGDNGIVSKLFKRKYIYVVCVVLLLALGYLLWMRKKKGSKTLTDEAPATTQHASSASGEPISQPTAAQLSGVQHISAPVAQPPTQPPTQPLSQPPTQPTNVTEAINNHQERIQQEKLKQHIVQQQQFIQQQKQKEYEQQQQILNQQRMMQQQEQLIQQRQAQSIPEYTAPHTTSQVQLPTQETQPTQSSQLNQPTQPNQVQLPMTDKQFEQEIKRPVDKIDF